MDFPEVVWLNTELVQLITVEKLCRSYSTRISASQAKSLNRQWQWRALANERASKRRAGGAGELDCRVVTNHRRLAGHDDGFEITRSPLQ